MAGHHIDQADGLTKALRLTPEQSTSLADLKSQYRAEIESSCERHCSLRMQIGDALFQPDWDRAKQEELAEKLCKAELASELATLDHIRAVHQLLDPGQKAKYEQLVRSSFREACPNNLHAAKHGVIQGERGP